MSVLFGNVPDGAYHSGAMTVMLWLQLV